MHHEINVGFDYIWKKGYELKVTDKVVRVFSTEYCEFLDLDQYNNIVEIEHNGNVIETINDALYQAFILLENI